MKKMTLWWLLFILLFPFSTVFAQNKPGVFTLTPGVWYEFFSSRRNLDNTVLPSLALAYNFDEKLALEFSAGMINTNSKASGNQGVHGTLYLLDGLYRTIPWKFLEPYLLGGIGLTSLKPNGLDSRQQMNANLGIGAQLFADKMVALRADIRDLYTFVGSENDVLVSFGISFLIG
ncbi:MAG: hypothetical protein A3E83_07780 [Gammaproteobacteria bacterium RIFCSPHIGHO2_12_FULL_41_20]|nr:MAG: hypothetical protein A3E83_07780 [Gammaproteobacteria bacterium RIFCSPHIGHO2_12_FULL_41_20]